MNRTLLERKASQDGEGFISLYRLGDGEGKYVTWRSNKDTPNDTYWGHYHDSLVSAVADYTHRA